MMTPRNVKTFIFLITIQENMAKVEETEEELDQQ